MFFKSQFNTIILFILCMAVQPLQGSHFQEQPRSLLQSSLLFLKNVSLNQKIGASLFFIGIILYFIGKKLYWPNTSTPIRFGLAQTSNLVTLKMGFYLSLLDLGNQKAVFLFSKTSVLEGQIVGSTNSQKNDETQCMLSINIPKSKLIDREVNSTVWLSLGDRTFKGSITHRQYNPPINIDGSNPEKSKPTEFIYSIEAYQMVPLYIFIEPKVNSIIHKAENCWRSLIATSQL